LLILGFLLIVVGGALAYVRLTPVPETTLTRWVHAGPSSIGQHELTGGFKTVLALSEDGQDVRLRLLDVIASTPAILRAEGVSDGVDVFVTRTKWVQFPDVTTVWVEDGNLHIMGHLVYGRSDLGVNKARILGWLAKAGLSAP